MCPPRRFSKRGGTHHLDDLWCERVSHPGTANVLRHTVAGTSFVTPWTIPPSLAGLFMGGYLKIKGYTKGWDIGGR